MGGSGSGSWQQARTNLAERCSIVSVWEPETSCSVRFSRGDRLGSAAICLEGGLFGPVLWSITGKGREQHVPLTTSQGTLGGLRWWFECPSCSGRCAKLYKPQGHPGYACRKCSRIAYACQRESVGDRWARRADKLYERVARKDSRGLWRKRKWIRKATYQRTRLEADDLDYASMGIGLSQVMALQRFVTGPRLL